ncbi:MAG: class I SAM-dependent methyltransferase [Pseudobutyrivibrio sp.]|nr:class I SAM-dependent methyltransferase [Pseudobutyrivibrio sp.]
MNQIKNIVEENKEYWLNRATGYSDVNKEELEGVQHKTWSTFLNEQIEAVYGTREKSSIKVLDIGAGPGFLSIILAELGYSVTAFDFAETMLEEAKKNAKELKDSISFVQGDAQNLPFAEDYDVIISRNLTWNLPHPDEAYKKWLGALRTGGLMMVFDANWYAYLVDEDSRAAFEHDRQNVKDSCLEDYNVGENFDVMEDIARRMPMTGCVRPAWDKEFLDSISAGQVSVQENIGQLLYSKKELINYSSTPLFMVRVVKG